MPVLFRVDVNEWLVNLKKFDIQMKNLVPGLHDNEWNIDFRDLKSLKTFPVLMLFRSRFFCKLSSIIIT
jgi:hypothetical protein